MQVGATTIMGGEQPCSECNGYPPILLGLIAFLCVLLAVWLIKIDSHPAIPIVARWISDTGNTLFLVIGFVALIVYCVKRQAWTSLRVVFATLILVTLVVHAQKFGFGYWLSRPSGALGGFPSGHATAAFALAYLIALYFPRWAVCGYGVAVAISWSRIPAGAHWPYQIIVGAVTGYILSLIITDKVVPYARYHRAILRWQHVLVWLVPFAAIWYTHHEYENGSRLLWYTLVPIACGVIIRLWQYARVRTDAYYFMQHRRQRYVRYIANTLICAGITMGTEIVWLVPIEMCLCVATYTLAERSWDAEPALIHPDEREERSAGSSSVVSKSLLSAYAPREWVFEASWAVLLLASGIKEMLA